MSNNLLIFLNNYSVTGPKTLNYLKLAFVGFFEAFFSSLQKMVSVLLRSKWWINQNYPKLPSVKCKDSQKSKQLLLTRNKNEPHNTVTFKFHLSPVHLLFWMIWILCIEIFVASYVYICLHMSQFWAWRTKIKARSTHKHKTLLTLILPNVISSIHPT